MRPAPVPKPAMSVGAFAVTAKDPKTRARTGVLRTPRGDIETPVFMPVSTQGSVKALAQEDLEALGVSAILSNSYHLYLRPGADVIEAAGGLHTLMDYRGAILTDSGGFQIFSLPGLRKVSDEGVVFSSHLDGSRHHLTPESVVRLQARIGSDMWTSLDECPPYPCTEAQARAALERTLGWTERSHRMYLEEKERRRCAAMFFPILQGSVYPELRRRAAEELRSLSFGGVALGGFSVGESKQMTWDTLERTTEHLPEDRPRYLMGMGAPEDLWEAVERGVDMLDCVWPTRLARNGQVMIRSGRLNVKNAHVRQDFSPLDPECGCPVCRRYSRGYLSHLFRSKELSVYRYLTIHNLHFTFDVMRLIRAAIREGRVRERKAEFLARYLSPAR